MQICIRSLQFYRLAYILLCPRHDWGGGIINWAAVSVRPSVCRVPRHNSRMERPKNLKIDRMEAHHKSNQRTHLEVKRSKVKVTRPINAHSVKSQYLPKGKTYELKLVCRWSTKIRIADKRHHLQDQRSKSQGHVMRDSCWDIKILLR